MSVHLHVRHVSLELPLFLQNARSATSLFKTLMGAAFDPPRREFRTILDDIDFSAHSGDRIGLLGRNGAGKSSLLRVLTGAYRPTRGDVEAVGTRQALLNVSLGFNGEATVLENVYLRGTAMGMRASQVRDVVEPVLEFAELQDKTHHRLKTLSSGQRSEFARSLVAAMSIGVSVATPQMVSSGAGSSSSMRASSTISNFTGGSPSRAIALRMPYWSARVSRSTFTGRLNRPASPLEVTSSRSSR